MGGFGGNVCPIQPLPGFSLIFQPTCSNSKTYVSNYYGWYEDSLTGNVEYGSCFVPPKLWNEIDCVPKYIRDIEEYEKNNEEVCRIVDDEELGYLTKEDDERHDAKSDISDEYHDANDSMDNEQKQMICVPDPAMITGANEDGSNQYSDAIVSKGKSNKGWFSQPTPTGWFGKVGRSAIKSTGKKTGGILANLGTGFLGSLKGRGAKIFNRRRRW